MANIARSQSRFAVDCGDEQGVLLAEIRPRPSGIDPWTRTNYFVVTHAGIGIFAVLCFAEPICARLA